METPVHRTKRVRWALFALAVVALFAAINACKSVADSVLSSRQGAQETANCVSDCAHAANEAIRVESDRHSDAMRACAGDTTCLANEDARHEAAVDAIQAQRKACQEACKHQGAGRGR